MNDFLNGGARTQASSRLYVNPNKRKDGKFLAKYVFPNTGRSCRKLITQEQIDAAKDGYDVIYAYVK